MPARGARAGAVPRPPGRRPRTAPSGPWSAPAPGTRLGVGLVEAPPHEQQVEATEGPQQPHRPAPQQVEQTGHDHEGLHVDRQVPQVPEVGHRVDQVALDVPVPGVGHDVQDRGGRVGVPGSDEPSNAARRPRRRGTATGWGRPARPGVRAPCRAASRVRPRRAVRARVIKKPGRDEEDRDAAVAVAEERAYPGMVSRSSRPATAASRGRGRRARSRRRVGRRTDRRARPRACRRPCSAVRATSEADVRQIVLTCGRAGVVTGRSPAARVPCH